MPAASRVACSGGNPTCLDHLVEHELVGIKQNRSDWIILSSTSLLASNKTFVIESMAKPAILFM